MKRFLDRLAVAVLGHPNTSSTVLVASCVVIGAGQAVGGVWAFAALAALAAWAVIVAALVRAAITRGGAR